MTADSLALDTAQLAAVRDALAARIGEGLAHDGREIRALPAFLRPPRPGVSGRVLTLDAGGTNLRAAIVEVDASGAARIIAGPLQCILPDGRDGASVGPREFFGAHVALARQLPDIDGLPVGYCFSYPSASEPDGDARLIRWTKGVAVEGVEGTRVGDGLSFALRSHGFDCGPVVVLNDTVASLLAAASHTANAARTIGLIVGTGHNLASFFDGAGVTKLTPRWEGPIAVNLESGNFTPPHLTAADEALDATSGDPGRQRMEKAVSGYFLPQLFTQLRPGRTDVGDGKALLAVAASSTDPDAALALALLDRSADLVAAAITAVASFHAPDGASPITVLAEGGFFHATPAYAARVRARLEALRGPSPIVLARAPDANLIGCAWAALGR